MSLHSFYPYAVAIIFDTISKNAKVAMNISNQISNSFGNRQRSPLFVGNKSSSSSIWLTKKASGSYTNLGFSQWWQFLNKDQMRMEFFKEWWPFLEIFSEWVSHFLIRRILERWSKMKRTWRRYVREMLDVFNEIWASDENFRPNDDPMDNPRFHLILSMEWVNFSTIRTLYILLKKFEWLYCWNW